VADDANWLTAAPLNENDPLAGRYDLTLLPEASTGGELTAGMTYSLGYFRQTLSGDLGSFWWSEISDPAQGSPLRVGPVPVTQSGLPTSLTVDFDASGLTRAVARTPSGGSTRSRLPGGREARAERGPLTSILGRTSPMALLFADPNIAGGDLMGR
jgi:hypothetical protein